MNTPDEAKRRLREFAERHDAHKKPWPKAALIGVGLGLALLATRGRARPVPRAAGGAGGVGKLLVASRLIAPLVPVAVSFIRAQLGARRGAPPPNGRYRRRAPSTRWVTPPGSQVAPPRQ